MRRGFIRAAAATAGAIAGTAVAVTRWVANAVYSPTVTQKTMQGASEISNMLYTGSAYAPYTADRAGYQNRNMSRGLDR
jgi:hypothetical protein